MEPNLQRHPYFNIKFGFTSSPYISHQLFPSFYRHFKISQSGGALPPKAPLRQHRNRIPLLALHIPPPFAVFLQPFLLFSKQWCLTSNVTPTPTSYSDFSPPVTYLNFFSHLCTTILTFLEAVEPNLQRHPYTNIRFSFLSSPYLTQHFFPPFYHHFNIS